MNKILPLQAAVSSIPMPAKVTSWSKVRQAQYDLTSSASFIQQWQQFSNSPSMGHMVASLVDSMVDALIKVI
jgi:hypothetical protein